jgi:hypothetical protein
MTEPNRAEVNQILRRLDTELLELGKLVLRTPTSEVRNAFCDATIHLEAATRKLHSAKDAML